MEANKDLWLANIQEAIKQIKGEFSSLTQEDLNFKVNPESWSIAENIQHLTLTANSYHKNFDEILSNQHTFGFLGKVKFLANFFGKVILNSVEPSRKKKIRTFPLWDPTQSDLTSEIFVEFENSQRALSTYIAKLEPFFGKNKMVASPANNKIVYPIETALEIITQHNFRHINQAKEVKKDLKK
ncbi:MAG: hypothetical protein ACJATA_000730 [Sphingobacteriales bacterium]|jgi:hypothetical protein